MVQPTKSGPPGEYFWSTFEPLTLRARGPPRRRVERAVESRAAVRGLRRHQDVHGLDDGRRTLVHRYTVDKADPPEPDETRSAQPPEPVERLIDLAVAEPETPADPAPAPSVLNLVPPAPERREGGEVSVDVFRQTLEHVVRLSAQVASAREEFSRRRERLAAG